MVIFGAFLGFVVRGEANANIEGEPVMASSNELRSAAFLKKILDANLGTGEGLPSPVLYR
jgi:hypothetical protein